jgi:hypothetical protein
VGGSGTKGFDEATLDSCHKMLFSRKTYVGSSNSAEDVEAEDKKCSSICLSEYGELEVVINMVFLYFKLLTYFLLTIGIQVTTSEIITATK